MHRTPLKGDARAPDAVGEMKPFLLKIWTNDVGPSVTGRRPVQAAVEDPDSGHHTSIADSAELQAFAQAAGRGGVALMLVELVTPSD